MPQERFEVWDDHHFKDDCPWKSEAKIVQSTLSPKFPLIFLRLMREIYSYFGRDRRYFREMRAFLALKPDSPVKRIREGQEFKVSDYPRGTIIRIAKAYAIGSEQPLEYDMWAFIQQEKTDPENNQMGDQIVGFPVHHFRIQGDPLPGYIAYRNWHSSFVVGEVIHDRSVMLGFMKDQSLIRYREVEIWKYGQAVRERVAEKSPSGALQQFKQA